MTHEGGAMMPIPRLQAEIYDPEAGRRQPAAMAQIVRLYHSVALLLPDGRVVTASADPPPYGNKARWEPPQDNAEIRLEIDRPPYLFRGVRPVITDAPLECGYGRSVTLRPCNRRRQATSDGRS